MRRQFQLPGDDAGHLEANAVVWESVIEGGVQWVILHGFRVPYGYNQEVVKLALRIEPGYPDTEIDTAYFNPPLSRLDGKAIRALHAQSLDGQQWQRWSRHRTPANPWRPGLDDLSGHLALVEHWLLRELQGA